MEHNERIIDPEWTDALLGLRIGCLYQITGEKDVDVIAYIKVD